MWQIYIGDQQMRVGALTVFRERELRMVLRRLLHAGATDIRFVKVEP